MELCRMPAPPYISGLELISLFLSLFQLSRMAHLSLIENKSIFQMFSCSWLACLARGFLLSSIHVLVPWWFFSVIDFVFEVFSIMLGKGIRFFSFIYQIFDVSTMSAATASLQCILCASNISFSTTFPAFTIEWALSINFGSGIAVVSTAYEV